MNNNLTAIATPEALRKKGITQVTNNIPEGKQLNISGSLIFQFFGKELQERFIEGGQYGSTANESTRAGSGK